MTYGALVAGYACAVVVMLAVAAQSDRLWPRSAHGVGLPLRYVLVPLGAVIAIGLLAQRGLLFPTAGEWRILTAALNQLLIFSPVFGVAGYALARGDLSRARVMLPRDHVPVRLGLGLLAALVALVAHHATLARLDDVPASFAQIVSPVNVSYLIQILGEDLAIAMLLASLLRTITPRTAVVATGLLFALGHVPAMIDGGRPASEFARLVADGLLAAGVVAALLRMRDVWVLWPVHVVMDLTQFLR
jgi:hypothetical protein